MDPAISTHDIMSISGIVLSLFEREGQRFSSRFDLEDYSGRINCYIRDRAARLAWYDLRKSLNDHTIITAHGRVTHGDYGPSFFVDTIDVRSDPTILAELRGARTNGYLWSTLIQRNDESLYCPLFLLDPDTATQYLKYIQGPLIKMRTKKTKGGWMEVLAHEPMAVDVHVSTIELLVKNVKKLYSQLKARCKKSGTEPPALIDFASSNPTFRDAIKCLSNGMTLRQRLVYVELPTYVLLQRGQK